MNAIMDGVTAYRTGMNKTDNPYADCPRLFHLYDDWNTGWEQAYKNHQKKLK